MNSSDFTIQNSTLHLPTPTASLSWWELLIFQLLRSKILISSMILHFHHPSTSNPSASCDSTLNIQNPTTSYHLPSFQVIYVTINSHLNYYKSLLTGLFHPCPLYRQQRSYSQIKYKSDLVTPVYKTAQ